MPGRIYICVFGPTRAERDGDPVDLGGTRIRSLLAALVAAGSQGATTDALIEMVWSDSAPATARKSVQKYVSTLRTLLSADIVETTATGYRLGPADIDINHMQQLVDDGDGHVADGEHKSALESYRNAIALVATGPPFADLADSNVAAPITNQLAEVAATVEERSIDLLIQLGRTGEAVLGAERLVADQPFRESAWALLMTALYRSNRQSDALRAYRRVQLLLAEELGIEPSTELRRLESRILQQDLDPPGRGPVKAGPIGSTGQLPLAYTSFVGREREIDELTDLSVTSRLVTVIGPGGSGKTRLAVETATLIAADRPAYFVDIARIEDAAQVTTVFASALGVAPEVGDDVSDGLTAGLQGRDALLLVDNCEHVLGAVAALTHQLLTNVRELAIIATSREPLGLTGEVVYALRPLPIPPPTVASAAEAGNYDAVQLFANRAQAAAPGFSLNDSSTGDVADVVAICRRLDGIPLAIELAARQLAVLTLDEVQRGLADGLDRLALPGEPIPRHRTLAAAIDWSYRLMDPSVQSFYGAITVFPGSFIRTAARRVWAMVGGSDDADALLDRLVAHSMLLRTPTADGSRYRLLEPIREFGIGRAADGFADGQLGSAHSRWVLELLSADARIFGPDERRTLRRLRSEDHHLSVALAWATANQPELALRLTIASTSYISMASYRFSWFDELQAAIEAADDAPTELRCRALAHAGFSLAENFADHEISSAYAHEALRLATATGDLELQTIATLTLASATRNAGQLDAAVDLHLDAIELADSAGAEVWAIRARRWLAFTEMQRANYARALEMISSARVLGEKIGSDWVTAKTLWLTAAVLALEGDYDEAERAASRSFELFAGFDDAASPFHVRAVQGDAARLSGDHQQAAIIYEECLPGFRDVGDRRCTASTLRNIGLTAVHLGRTHEARTHLLDALKRRVTFGDEAGIAECLEALTLTAWSNRAATATLVLGSAAEALRDRSGSRPPEPERRDLHSTISAAVLAAGPDRAASASTAGLALLRQPELTDAVTEVMGAPHLSDDDHDR